MNQQIRTAKLQAAREACESYILAGPSWVVEETDRQTERGRERERETKTAPNSQQMGTLISASAVPKPRRSTGRKGKEERDQLAAVSASVVVGRSTPALIII